MYKIDFISSSYDLWSCFSYHTIKCVYNTMTIQNIKISISGNATYSNFEPALQCLGSVKATNHLHQGSAFSFLFLTQARPPNLEYWSGHQFKIRERAVSFKFLCPRSAPSSPTVSLSVILQIPIDLRWGLSAHLPFKGQYFWKDVVDLIICEKGYSLFLLLANFYCEKPDADLPKAESENIKACQMVVQLTEAI